MKVYSAVETEETAFTWASQSKTIFRE